MNTDIAKFFQRLFILSFVLLVCGWLLFRYILKDLYLPVLPYTLLLFFVVTALVHVYQVRQAGRNIIRFTKSNMLATTFKLIVYSVFAFTCLAVNPEKPLVFVTVLFFLYIVYTFFEVSELTRFNRKINEKK